MNNIRLKPFASAGGTLFALGFIVCFIWGAYLNDAVLAPLYLNLMKLSFLSFNGYDFGSFILGLIQSYIWGVLAALVFGHCYNFCNKYLFKQ